MIGFVSFLKAAGIGVDANSLKVHLACWNGKEHPIDIFFAGTFKEWQEQQNRRNFQCRHIIALVDLGQSEWLFAGVYEVLGCRQNLGPGTPFIYNTRLLPGQNDLIGRVVVSHLRSGRASYIWSTDTLPLTILEIRREKLTIGEFPGYNAVVLSHSQLKIITEQKIASWHGALANIKGIYLITDTSTGRHYIGKASGNQGIWQRWCAYAENGHGGNVELKRVLREIGPGQMAHFQYSILEIADTHASDADITARESHWMLALKTRKFGLNR
ncbi:MAG TPA: GIY-YIG nuclease family protein [Lacunisphaera sp.]|nr:GIY-YIG nuclease family protein [Lacunisphaera sp.]